MSLTTKIPDGFLKKFVCFECGRYLSKAPIYIKTEGENICGDCSNRTTTTTTSQVIRCCLLEEMASFFSFPCNYRAQGCSEYIQFDKGRAHEVNCIYRTYVCPISLYSSCTWVGTVCEIYNHYKKSHPELRLHSPCFKIKLIDDCELYYIVKVDGAVFLLQVKFLMLKMKLKFGAVYIGDVADASLVTYRIKLSSVDNGRIMELEEEYPKPITHTEMCDKDSVDVNVNGLSNFLQYPSEIYCCWTFFVPDELKICHRINPLIKFQSENQIECPNCNFTLVPPTYRCILGHLTCANCKGYKNTCGVCQKSNVEFLRALDVENAAQEGLFYCKWTDCLRGFGCYEILQHEQECSRREYECPKCNMDVGKFEWIIEHFHTHHKEIPIQTADKTNSIEFPVRNCFSYVLVSNEIFKVNVFIDQSYVWTVEIDYCGPPALDNCWKYEIRDCYNILYYASKFCHNIYKVKQANPIGTLRTQYYFNIKFVKNKKTDFWLPIDQP